ncbi:hypothetical protein IKH79_04505 [Candidatus Saccharibacteria bacterium]|nr:hypothetical protein [Candidatus Saccharibacteria bacterium]
MLAQLITNELPKSKDVIDDIKADKIIDCVGVFTKSDKEYASLNAELKDNKLIDEMPSGNLYYLNTPIQTEYGDLFFVKIRKPDNNFNDYRIYVDFVVDDYEQFRNTLDNPTIKTFDKFELIEFKNNESIVNVVSLSAKDDYELN